MQTRHPFNALAMKLRLSCIKPLKLYVNLIRGWKHISISCSYNSDAKRIKQGYLSFFWHCNTF